MSEVVKENVENTPQEETFDMDSMSRMVDVINSDILRKDIIEQKETINQYQDGILEQLAGLNQDKEFLNEKLAEWNSVEALKAHLKSEKNVHEFFTNPETGEELGVATDMSPSREVEFKRDLLIFLKTSDIQMKKIDEEYDKLDEATKEFQENVSSACERLSDNVLAYVGMLRDRAEACEDNNERRRLLKSIDALDSGFTMKNFSDIYAKSSIAKHCKKDLLTPTRVADIGKRYMAKLQSTLTKKDRPTRVSLIPYVSSNDYKSFEERVLVEGEYELPDLFVFSLIRYFAVSDWNDETIRQAHASVALTIRKLLNNEFEDELKVKVKTAIIEYLKLFNV